jgi:hypothetical protein
MSRAICASPFTNAPTRSVKPLLWDTFPRPSATVAKTRECPEAPDKPQRHQTAQQGLRRVELEGAHMDGPTPATAPPETRRSAQVELA